MAPIPLFVFPNWLHVSIVSLLSDAYFSGLNTEPDALGLYRVSYINGFVGSVVCIAVYPLPVTRIVEFSAMVPIANGVMSL